MILTIRVETTSMNTLRAHAPGTLYSHNEKVHIYIDIGCDVIVILEGATLILVKALVNDAPNRAEIDNLRNKVIATPHINFQDTFDDNEIDPSIRKESVHPYIGFVANPDGWPAGAVNKYGFFGPSPVDDVSSNKNDNAIRVVVLGGSVAFEIVAKAKNELVKGLKQLPQLKRKQIVVFPIALPGMKQPQQLMALNYFILLGFKPNIVINIDGFNEIVLPIVENHLLGVSPYYPRSWKNRLSNYQDIFSSNELLLKAGRIAYREEFRSVFAKSFAMLPLSKSLTANYLWFYGDKAISRSIARARLSLTNRLRDGDSEDKILLSYEKSGPKIKYADDNEIYQMLTRLWINSSIMIGHMAKNQGFRYYHFLQPNQHVEGSKIFTDEERTVALPEVSDIYADVARRGYPYLRDGGKRLKERAINFFDLTMIFKNSDEILYSDSCCHFVNKGYKYIAARIASEIASNY